MLSIISKIVRKKRQWYFISPHLDDAILSSGALIFYLVQKVPVKVITIFTKTSQTPYTRFAKKFTNSCGYEEANKLFSVRRREDREVCKKLNIKYYHRGFVDAAWRKKDGKHVYPTEKEVFGGTVSQKDDLFTTQIKKSLQSLVATKTGDIAFCPIGIGNHVDHVLTRDICKDIFPNLIYWSDFPYSLTEKVDQQFVEKIALKSFVWKKDLREKERLIRLYQSQIKPLFPKNYIPRVPERYYFSQAILKMLE